jgi:hypothetical protein
MDVPSAIDPVGVEKSVAGCRSGCRYRSFSAVRTVLHLRIAARDLGTLVRNGVARLPETTVDPRPQ